MNFADRLLAAIDARQNPGIVGLDTDFTRVPGFLKERYTQRTADPFQAAAQCLLEFNRQVIAAVADVVPAIKIQIAFYEMMGINGLEAFQETIALAKRAGLLVIGDAKRGDIGHTAGAYAKAFLGKVDMFGEEFPIFDVDALTVNAWTGSDGIRPFLEEAARHDKGIFVLVKTSNPSSGELQDLDCGGQTVVQALASLTDVWGRPLIGARGYSSVGAVVGATWPNEAEIMRVRMPNAVLLVPGYGAQGGGADDVIPCFNRDGYGAVINSSRDILFAWQKQKRPAQEFAAAAREAALAMREALKGSLEQAGIWPW